MDEDDNHAAWFHHDECWRRLDDLEKELALICHERSKRPTDKAYWRRTIERRWPDANI